MLVGSVQLCVGRQDLRVAITKLNVAIAIIPNKK